MENALLLYELNNRTMENLGTGIMLMCVGMLTVFCILLIVIYGSRLLIAIVGRIAPGTKETAAAQTSPDVTSVLEEAVRQITSGKGRIVKITEI